MKKILVLLTIAFFAASCTTPSTPPATPATDVPADPATDTVTSASPKGDATTCATENTNGEMNNVKYSVEEIKKMVTDKEPNAVFSDIDLDYDNNKIVYECDVTYNNQSYDIKIDANNGEIIKWELDN